MKDCGYLYTQSNHDQPTCDSIHMAGLVLRDTGNLDNARLLFDLLDKCPSCGIINPTTDHLIDDYFDLLKAGWGLFGGNADRGRRDIVKMLNSRGVFYVQCKVFGTVTILSQSVTPRPTGYDRSMDPSRTTGRYKMSQDQIKLYSARKAVIGMIECASVAGDQTTVNSLEKLLDKELSMSIKKRGL